MVRGLGAERGELEVNTLAVVDGKSGSVHWAPEVEWAFAHGHAIELELPLVDRQLDAIKLALQGTLPSPLPAFTHGWQIFGEVGLDHGQTDVVGVYLLGHRFAPKWSYSAILGANVHLNENGQTSLPLDEAHRARATAIGNLWTSRNGRRRGSRATPW